VWSVTVVQFNQKRNVSTGFRKNCKYDFKFRSVAVVLIHADGRTDRLDKHNTLFAFERVESVLTGISGIATVSDIAEMLSALGSAALLVPWRKLIPW